MDHLNEAKKFIQRAQGASNREVINQHLAMADWYLNEALKERDGTPESQQASQTVQGPGTVRAAG
ncbi:MAG TPA: hypothetical protein VEW64_01920 [Methyloceanibacter sp.]|jgi:hypothetical protein|nr:hypothetical protein [Methyloceanibacter sp.]